MSEQLKEALSAVVDGEASEFELRRVLDEMGKDEGLNSAWQSYHLIRQAAQGENVQGVAEMGERIWASLDADDYLQQDIVQEEPVVFPAAPQPRSRGVLVGGAVAAALALGVFVTGTFESTGPANEPSIASSNTANTAVEASMYEAPVLATPSDQAPAVARTIFNAPAQSVSGGSGFQTVASQSAETSQEFNANDDFDYGPGFVPYSEVSPAEQARSDGYFLHHVQHQAVNNDNVLLFMKMISYPQ